MTEHTEAVVASWERHVHTLIGVILSGLLYWNGTAVVSLGEQVAVINVRLEQFVDIKKELVALKIAFEKEHDERISEESEIKERLTLLEYEAYKKKEIN